MGCALRTVNSRRRRRLYKRNFGAKADWIRDQSCALCGCPPETGAIHAAHVRARGMGGCGGSLRDLVPLCGLRGCHALQESMSVESLTERFGVDLRRLADSLHEAWLEESA